MSNLSYEKLRTFDRCPRRYHDAFVARYAGQPTDAARMARAGRDVLDALLNEHKAAGQRALLSRSRAAALWEDAFARHGLSGPRLYEDGLAVIDGVAIAAGPVDPAQLLGVRVPFEVTLGGHTVRGTFDRVDRSADDVADVVEIREYRWGHVICDGHGPDQRRTLTLSVLAAAALWPWAKRVRLRYDHVRYGHSVTIEAPIEANRPDDRVLAQLTATADAIATAHEYDAHVAPDCAVCPYRQTCGGYQAQLSRDLHDDIPEDPEDLVNAYAETLDADLRIGRRRRRLNELLRVHLDERGDLTDGETLLRLQNVARARYPAADTVAVLASATGHSERELLERFASIDGKGLARLLKTAKLDRDAKASLEGQLAALAEVSHSPRLWTAPLERALDAPTA